MESVLAVAGVGIDRAWSQFDPATGARLRQSSQDLLHAVVAAAYDHGVDALVVVGDLFDRATSRPSAVTEVRTLFAALDIPVVVVPGVADWIGPGSPYSYGDWSGAEVATDSAPTAVPSLSGWLVAAVTRPQGVTSALPSVPPGAVVVTPSYDGLAPASGQVLTSGARFAAEGGLVVVPPLVAPGGEAVAVLLREGLDAKPVVLGDSVVRLLDLDISSCDTTADLIALLDASATGEDCVHLRLVGRLAQGVLLPGYADWSPRAGVTVDVEALDFVAPTTPDPGAQTADAQFMRAMAQLDVLPRERHQATALGLLAMAEEA